MTSEPSQPKLPLYVGVDVGGTNIKIGLIDDQGSVVAGTSFPTQASLGPARAVEEAKKVVGRLLESKSFEWKDVSAVGLGTPGPMDLKKGVLLTPSNLPTWHHYPIRVELENLTGKSVTYANDASAAAFGEFWIGEGRDHDSMVLITLGTGVGGGIIVDNISIDGANSHGTEIGHIVIDTSAEARMCGCGLRGHLEAYASATAVVGRMREALADMAGGNESMLNEQITEASPLSALMIYEAAMANDELACQIIEETAIYLGRGISILAHVIDPSLFLLGGAMNFGGRDSDVGQRFIQRVRQEVKENTFPVVAERLRIEFAQLGSDAGFIGAAGLSRQASIR